MSLNSEQSLRVVCDTFVTFLYAAAVHLIIAHSVARPGALTVRLSVIVLLYILHLFSDWLSRVRLPSLLPADDPVSTGNQLAKTLLEVGGLFFLVLAWLSLLDATAPHVSLDFFSLFFGQRDGSVWTTRLTPERAFAVFLSATFFWNLFMLKVMRQLRWVDLARLILAGDALDSEKVEVYAPRFWRYRQKLERRVESWRQQQLGAMAVVNPFAFPALLVDAFVRGFAQLVAFHIAWAGILGCIVILLGDVVFDGRPLAMGMKAAGNHLSWPFAILSFAAFSVIAPAMDVLKTHGNWNRPVTRALGRGGSVILRALGLSSFVFFGVKLSVGLADFVCPFGGWIIGFGAASQAVGFILAAHWGRTSRSRIFMLRLSGTLGAMAMFVVYLTLQARLLMIMLAVQQVVVNAFLQYAASRIFVSISPRKMVASPGGTQQFTATVTGTDDGNISWGAPGGGLINTTGMYTAPAQPGRYTVYAVSCTDRSRFAEATVVVM